MKKKYLDNMELWKKAASLRTQFGEDAASPIDVFALANSIENLSLVIFPMGEHISGMCIKNPDSNVIAINSGMTLGRQRFSLAHEFYHLYFDDDELTAVCSKGIGGGDMKEREADQFASYFLVPPMALEAVIHKRKKNNSSVLAIQDIVALEQYFQVSRQAILYRLMDEHKLSYEASQGLRENVIWSAASQGYSSALYCPSPEDKQAGTYGAYIRNAQLVLEKKLISNGKYEELLLDGFREDLVYGENEGDDIFD